MMTLVTLINRSRFELATVGMPTVWTTESLRPTHLEQPLLTLGFVTVALYKCMNTDAFLKLNLVLGHDACPPEPDNSSLAREGLSHDGNQERQYVIIIVLTFLFTKDVAENIHQNDQLMP